MTRLARISILAFCLLTAAGCSANQRGRTGGPQSESKVARVLVAGDSRGKAGFADILKVAREVTADKPVTVLITPGDMDPFETTRQQIISVFGETTEVNAEAAKGVTWYPVVGNHEATAGPETMQQMRAFYREHLAKTTAPGPDGSQETTYSFDVGPMHVAVLNEYWDGNTTPGSDVAIRDAVVPALRTWLERDLKATNKPFKVVVGHEPAYPQLDQDFHEGRHADSSLNARIDERDAFWKVLEEQRVTMLLCGHTHRYSRFRPEGSRVWQVDGAQARNDASWKYDAFVVLTASDQALRMDAYRHLNAQEKWEVTDTMTLRPDGTVVSASRTATETSK